MYTDGSRIEEKARCGLVLFEDEWALPVEEFYKGPAHSTVFQMEIKAIERAAAKLENEWQVNPYLAREAEIMVDSQAAILALENEITDSAEVMKCKNALNQAGTLGKLPLNGLKLM